MNLFWCESIFCIQTLIHIALSRVTVLLMMAISCERSDQRSGKSIVISHHWYWVPQFRITGMMCNLCGLFSGAIISNGNFRSDFFHVQKHCLCDFHSHTFFLISWMRCTHKIIKSLKRVCRTYCRLHRCEYISTQTQSIWSISTAILDSV